MSTQYIIDCDRYAETPSPDRAATLFADLVDLPGALLPILHRIQERLGYVPPEYIPTIARELNLSHAEVHGVVSFYHEFRSAPPGARIVRICQAEACQAMGTASLTAHAESRLGTKLGETRADGAVTLETVYCLGNCACAPAMMVDGTLHGRVTPARFDELVAEGVP